MQRVALILAVLAICALNAYGRTSLLSIAADNASAPAPAVQQTNCTPPRTLEDSSRPFCFVPDTISAEAREFLSQTAAGATPFGSSSAELTGPDPVLQASVVGRLRAWFNDFNTIGLAAAEALYLGKVSNSSIGNVPVVIALPKGVNETSPANTKVLLYIHGGGYAVGACLLQLNTVAATAATAGLTIICPEYRLAPEHPFPAGIDDVLTAYKTMITSGGYNPKNIVPLGDSAGGGMVAQWAVQLKREGVALPAALGMFSPWADLRNKGDTSRTLTAIDPIIATPDMGKGDNELAGLGGVYVGNNASLLDDPLVSPVLADYAALFPGGSLPPTLIQVGTRELLLSDAVRLYHRMKEAAPAPGHVVISPYEGMWHVFQAYLAVPEAAIASKEMADYFTRALHGDICK